MLNANDHGGEESVSRHLYDVNSSDPHSELVDRSGLSVEEISQVGRLMRALSQLRQTEQSLSEASEKYMKLNKQDMRALHYLIVAANRKEVATPGMLASHLNISAASTTKLLNRLEQGSHVVRRVHPTDRRAFAIEVTPATRTSAMETVGRQQANRFYAAARLTPQERDVVIGFLEDMTREISPENAAWAKTDPGER